MLKPSSEGPEGVGGDDEVQGGFMFVALTGKKDQTRDQGTSKRLRAHVMHNFREKEAKLNQQKASPEKGSAQRNTSAGAGQKLRFRLGKNGKLGESVPLRQRQKSELKWKDEEVEETVERWKKRTPNLPSPNLEAWTRQYFREEEDSLPDLQPDVRLPCLVAPSTKPQFGTLTEGYFEEEAPRTLWDEINVDYSLTPTTTALAQIPLPISPLLPFGISRLDPLNTLPFQLSRRDEEFIDRFQHWETDSWCPVNGRGAWFTYAMQNELLFHATMYHWGMHFSRPKDFHFRNPEIMEHKLSSFRMINQRLSNVDEIIEDETVAAVAAIVNVEISFGSREEAKKHMVGLETLVDVRGGIESFEGSMNGILQRFVGWNDLNYAELSGSRLRFAKDCLYLPGFAQAEEPCFRRSILGIDYDPLIWQKLQGDVIDLLHEIRVLCEEVSVRPYRGLQEQEKVDRSDAFHRIERKLRFLTVINEEGVIVQTASDRVWRATALAGLIYVHYMLRFLPLAYRQFNSLSRDLQTAMALTGGSHGSWKNAPEILVWALTTGTIISAGRMEHGWYVERLASACQEVGYTGWDRYREKMKSFLWVERLDDVRYKAVWDQVELLM